MSGFTAAAVNALDFDFAGIPAQDGSGLLTEKGVVAEPTDLALSTFFSAMSEVQKEALAAAEAGALDGSDAVAKVRSAVIDVCGGTPTAASLMQLPPRYLVAFSRWLTNEFGGGDPKD